MRFGPPPVDLATAQEQLLRGVRAVDTPTAPSAWRVEVPRRDHARAGASGWADALQVAALHEVRERGLGLTGVLTVEVVPVDDLLRGRVRVTSSDGPPRLVPAPDPGVPGRPRLVLPAGGDAPVGSYESAGLQRELLLPAGTTLLGRAEGAGVHLDAAGVVARHAELVVAPDGTQVEVRDLGSAAGTRVDGVPRSRWPLTDGSRLQLGEALLVLRVDPLPTEGRQGGGPEPDDVHGDEEQGSTTGTPVGPGPVAAGVRRTPNALWLAVALILAGVVLVGLAVALLDGSATAAVGCLVAGVVLGTAGLAQAYRGRIFEDVS